MKQQVKLIQNNKGFTLSEILAAVLIMSMMMVAIVSFVDYSSRIWRTGQEAVNNKNYSRLTFDLISQELMKTEKIDTPTLGENPINFIRLTTKNTTKIHSAITLIDDITPKKIFLYRGVSETSAKGKKKSGDVYEEILLANNVATFTVTRLSTSTVQITLAIESSEEDEDGNHDIISSDTMILYAPMIR